MFLIENNEQPICPKCHISLQPYDHKKRHRKLPGGEKQWLLIPRYKCNNKNCECVIHSALPDFLLPYKHYQTQNVQDVYDDVVNESDKDYEDYPCEKTMKLWKKWIKVNILVIESMIRSVGYKYLDFSSWFLKYQGSLFKELRERLHSCWLYTIIRWIYNSGGYLNAVY